MPRLAPVTRAVTSYAHGILQSKAKPGLGRNFDPLSLGENLHRAARPRAARSADSRSFASAKNTTQDRAHCSRAADHFGALGAARPAGGGDLLRREVDHPAVHTHRYQVERELGTAADFARLLVLDQLGDDIGAARYHRLALDDNWIIEAGLERLAKLAGLGIHAIDHANFENRAGRNHERAGGPGFRGCALDPRA